MANIPFSALDHVQLAIPRGGEDEARRFYVDLLGMTEVAKPEGLRKQGGAWFTSGSVSLHLRVEEDFRAAKKAHPALRCTNYADLTRLLREAGVTVVDDLRIPEFRRCHIFDPFGNRIELVGE